MNLSETWQTWLHVFTSPSEETFEAERQKPNATLETALVWMLIAGVTTAVLGIFQSILMPMLISATLPKFLTQVSWPQALEEQLLYLSRTGALGSQGAGNLWSIISIPISLLTGTGIHWFIAILLGGVGEYRRYAYLIATFIAPWTILVALLKLIPLLGFCILLIVGWYEFIQIYYATKVEHQLSRGRTLVVILTPTLLSLLLLSAYMMFFFVNTLAPLLQLGS